MNTFIASHKKRTIVEDGDHKVLKNEQCIVIYTRLLLDDISQECYNFKRLLAVGKRQMIKKRICF